MAPATAMTGFSTATLVMAAGLLFAFLSASLTAGTIKAGPKNLQAVLDAAGPGDTILLEDGLYKGGLHLKHSGEEGAPITIKAAGAGVVVDGGDNALQLDGVSWVTIDGIRFQNAGVAGIYVRSRGWPEAPYGETDPLQVPFASHITIRNCVCADNVKWGIITSHIDHFTVEGCETYGSKIQHGIYVANSSDYALLRNNTVHHNAGNGIHINGDPDCAGNGLIRWALVENNRIFENGKLGGSAMSIMQVQDSLFRNNLLYNNYAHGFTLFWYTGDEATQSSKRNQVYNNTVFFRPGEGRFSLLMRRSSTDCKVKNNIFVGGARGAMYVEPSCLDGLDIDHNVIFNYPGQRLFGDALEGVNFDSEDGSAERLEAWSALGFEPDVSSGVEISMAKWAEKGFDVHSTIGVAPQFADVEEADFHLAPGSPGIEMGTDLGRLVPTDIDDTPRPRGGRYDCGCYERKGY